MATMTATRSFHTPVRLVYGRGSVATVGPELASSVPKAQRALIVTDTGVQAAGITEQVENALAAAGMAITTVAVSGEPTEHDVAHGVGVLTEHEADVIVGVGGGSALDAGKAINAAAHNGGEIRAFEGFDQIPNSGLAFVSVPTTADTGSEVGCGMVIADTAARRKYLVVDKAYWPTLALLDPGPDRVAPASRDGMVGHRCARTGDGRTRGNARASADGADRPRGRSPPGPKPDACGRGRLRHGRAPRDAAGQRLVGAVVASPRARSGDRDPARA